MFVIVAGSGRLGAGLARTLSMQGNDVVVVSKSLDSRWLGAEFDGVTIEGDPIEEEVLERAGIRKAEIFVAATSEDVVNAMAAQIAREVFGVPLAIARMTDPARERFYGELGLVTVCPTSTGINQILDRIQGSIFSVLNAVLDPGIAGVHPAAEWLGKSLGAIRLPGSRRVLGLERKGRLLPYEANCLVQEGDILVLRGARGGEAS